MRTKEDPLPQDGPREPTAEELERMPQTLHTEGQNTGSGTVRDMAIGTSDGLTVPFPLAAGLSRATFMMAKMIS